MYVVPFLFEPMMVETLSSSFHKMGYENYHIDNLECWSFSMLSEYARKETSSTPNISKVELEPTLYIREMSEDDVSSFSNMLHCFM